MMHGGAYTCTVVHVPKTAKPAPVLGYSHFLRLKLLLLYIVSNGGRLPPALPLALRAVPPTRGKYPAIQSEGHLYPYPKSNFKLNGGRRGWVT